MVSTEQCRIIEAEKMVKKLTDPQLEVFDYVKKHINDAICKGNDCTLVAMREDQLEDISCVTAVFEKLGFSNKLNLKLKNYVIGWN